MLGVSAGVNVAHAPASHIALSTITPSHSPGATKQVGPSNEQAQHWSGPRVGGGVKVGVWVGPTGVSVGVNATLGGG